MCLKFVDLSWNYIGRRGGVKLCECLKVMPALIMGYWDRTYFRRGSLKALKKFEHPARNIMVDYCHFITKY